MIGELASLFISYIGVEVDFRRNHIAVELYLAQLNVSTGLKNRAHAFMLSLWFSHSGVNYDAVFEEISPPIRVACALHIAQQPLNWFMRTVSRPLSWEGPSELHQIANSIAMELRFEGYPHEESIVAECSISHAMYFVTKGHLQLQSNAYAALHHPVGCVPATKALASVLHDDQFCERNTTVSPRHDTGSSLGTTSFPSVCAETPAAAAINFEAQASTMRAMMQTPRECCTVFRGILLIVSPNDPLDWKANFGRPIQLASVPTEAERRSLLTQALAGAFTVKVFPTVNGDSIEATSGTSSGAMHSFRTTMTGTEAHEGA